MRSWYHPTSFQSHDRNLTGCRPGHTGRGRSLRCNGLDLAVPRPRLLAYALGGQLRGEVPMLGRWFSPTTSSLGPDHRTEPHHSHSYLISHYYKGLVTLCQGVFTILYDRHLHFQRRDQLPVPPQLPGIRPSPAAGNSHMSRDIPRFPVSIRRDWPVKHLF